MTTFDTVSVVTDLYQAGITEDGTPFIAEVYLVVAEKEDGTRWAHSHTFPGAEVGVSEDGFSFFDDVREDAKDQAEALAARVEEAGEINLLHWSPTYPAYGSPAYQNEPMYH